MCGSALSIICWQSFSSKKEEISTTSGCRLPELSQILEVTHCTRTEKSIFQEVSKKMYVYINILYIYDPGILRQHTSFVYTSKIWLFFFVICYPILSQETGLNLQLHRWCICQPWVSRVASGWMISSTPVSGLEEPEAIVIVMANECANSSSKYTNTFCI